MGKLVVTEFVSMDGVFEDPGGAEGFEHGGWTFKFDRGDEGNRFKLDELMNADVQLFGRVTYEGFAAAWPSRTDDIGFAARINSMPKVVVSTTLDEASWENSTIVRDDVAARVAELKEQYARDILVAGSGALARFLMGAGLVDELRLMVFPVVLGTGQRLFGDGTAHTTWKLASTQDVGPDGVTILTYTPAEVR